MLLFFNEFFDWCVDLLIAWAAALGMTYKEINVWIFCIIEPLIFFFMLYVIIRQRRQIRTFVKKG